MPCDDHRHYHRFSGAGGEFERRSADEGIGRFFGSFVNALQVAQESLAVGAPGCRFGEPDEGFHGFDLAEEGTDIAEGVVSPVMQQAGGFGGNLPLAAVEFAPAVDGGANFVDSRGWIVVVFLAGGESQFLLIVLLAGRGAFALLRFGDGGNELRVPARIDDAGGGASLFVQLPVATRVLVGAVEDRLLEEVAGHW